MMPQNRNNNIRSTDQKILTFKEGQKQKQSRIANIDRKFQSLKPADQLNVLNETIGYCMATRNIIKQRGCAKGGEISDILQFLQDELNDPGFYCRM